MSFKNNKLIGKQLVASLGLLVMIVPQTVVAALPPIPPSPTSRRLGGEADNPLNIPEYTRTLIEARRGTGDGGQTAKARQVLSQRRQNDYLVCQAEARGRPPTLGQLITEPIITPLKTRIDEAIQLQAVPRALDTATGQTLEHGVSERLRTNMRPKLETMFERVEQNFSSNFQRRLASENLTLAEASRDRGRFTDLVRASLRESFPSELNEDFIGNEISSALDGAFRDSLKDSLTFEFNQIARPTLETYYRPMLVEMIAKTIPDAIQGHVQSLTDTLTGTKIGIEAAIKNLKSIFAGPSGLGFLGPILGLIEGLASVPDTIERITGLFNNLVAQIDALGKFLKWLEQLDADKLVDDIIEGMALQMTQVLTDPKNINRLADAIGNALTDPINASIEENIDKVIDAVFEPIAALETAIDTFDDIIVDLVSSAVDNQLNLFINSITDSADQLLDSIGDTVAKTIDDTLGQFLYPPADQINPDDPSTWGIARNISASAISIGDRLSGSINTAGFALHDAIWTRPEVVVVPDDFFDTTVGPFPPNYVRESDFNIAATAGFALVPDGVALRPGEMHLSDYQTIVEDEPQLVGPEMEALAANGATATEEGTAAAVNNAVAAQAPAGSATLGDLGNGFLTGLSGGFASVVTSGITSVVGGVPYVGPILEQAAKKAIDAALTAAGAIKPAAPGLAVNEVGLLLSISGGIESNTGQIAKNTGQIAGESAAIREMTEKMLGLQVEICTHLRVIRRIQEAIEEKEFYYDAAARQAAAQTLFSAQNAFVENVILRGRLVSDLGIADDSESQSEDNRQEAFGIPSKIFEEKKKEELKKLTTELRENLSLDAPYGSLLITALEGSNQDPDLNIYNIGVSPEDMRRFYEEPHKLTWAEYKEIRNRINANPFYRQALTTYQLKVEREARVEDDYRQLLAHGNGLLPNIACDEWIEEGGRQVACREYRLVTPGAVRAEQLASFVTAVFDQLKNVSEVNEAAIARAVANALAQWDDLTLQPQTARQSPLNKNNQICTGPVCPDESRQVGQQIQNVPLGVPPEDEPPF